MSATGATDLRSAAWGHLPGLFALGAAAEGLLGVLCGRLARVNRDYERGRRDALLDAMNVVRLVQEDSPLVYADDVVEEIKGLMSHGA